MVRLELTLGAIACILVATGGARAQNGATVVLPPVDLVATEVAQVSIMSAAGAYPGWTFWSPCQGVITFYGADGAALGTPAAFTIGQLPQIFSAQLPYALTGATGPGVFVSAHIALTQEGSAYSGPVFIPPCASVFSLSTYDATTGVTHAFTSGQTGFGAEVGSVQVMPCTYMPSSSCSSEYTAVPAQVITLPPVNLAASETVEVGVVSASAAYSGSPGICGTSTITFYRADGSEIGTPVPFTVGKTPQIVSAQLPYAGTGATTLSAAISAQIALNVTPGPVAYDSTIPPCVIAFSMKTFDTLTGLTHAFSAGLSTPAAPYAAAGGSVPAAPEHRKPHGPPGGFGPDR